MTEPTVVDAESGAFRKQNRVDSAVSGHFTIVSKPARLRLKLDRETIRASRGDLAFATLEITDAQGAPIPDIVRRIDFHVDGAGELAAVGNANPKDVASFRVPFCRTFHWKCLVVLRSLGKEGQITLQARSEGLTPASVVVKCASV